MYPLWPSKLQGNARCSYEVPRALRAFTGNGPCAQKKRPSFFRPFVAHAYTSEFFFPKRFSLSSAPHREGHPRPIDRLSGCGIFSFLLGSVLSASCQSLHLRSSNPPFFLSRIACEEGTTTLICLGRLTLRHSTPSLTQRIKRRSPRVPSPRVQILPVISHPCGALQNRRSSPRGPITRPRRRSPLSRRRHRLPPRRI